jgi:hypothetical protein
MITQFYLLDICLIVQQITVVLWKSFSVQQHYYFIIESHDYLLTFITNKEPGFADYHVVSQFFEVSFVDLLKSFQVPNAEETRLGNCVELSATGV